MNSINLFSFQIKQTFDLVNKMIVYKNQTVLLNKNLLNHTFSVRPF